jgi:hypothetical protein
MAVRLEKTDLPFFEAKLLSCDDCDHAEEYYLI